MDLLPCSVLLTFDDGQGGRQGGCLVWFWLLILRPDALPVTNNTLLVPGPRRYSLRRSIVMPDRRASNIYKYIYIIYVCAYMNVFSCRCVCCAGKQQKRDRASLNLPFHSR